MRSFWAIRANPSYQTRIHPALTSFADECCGTLARLLVYVGTLALLAIFKDVLHWAGEGEKPVAELEIYRPGDEISRSGPAGTGIGDRMDPNGGRQLESAGVADQPRCWFS